MATGTVCFYVPPGQGKIGCGMVEAALSFTPGMAGKTGNVVILIAVNVLMTVIHRCFCVLMAVGTGELSVIACLFVAFSAIVPRAVMTAGINGEKPGIMYRKFRRLPTRIRGMTIQATGRKIDLLVIGRVGGGIILLMAGIAIGRDLGVTTCCMAKCAADGVPAGKREKAVLNISANPSC